MKKVTPETLAALGIEKAEHAGMCSVCGQPIYGGDLIRLTWQGETCTAQHADHSYGDLTEYLSKTGAK